MKTVLFSVALAVLAVGCKSGDSKSSGSSGAWSDKAAAGKDLWAVMRTSEGDITIKLWSTVAPKTVKNFVGLSTGEREWKNPASGLQMKTPLYNGTVFHRVIPRFMIQGGDPLGSGMGDPGYRFEDETGTGKTFDRVGLLAMANSGPNTNGSQFFITTSTPTYLNGKHTIFGEVVKGYEVAEKISNVPRGPGDRPNTPVVIKQIDLFDAQP